ncbi:MAG: hypothetical protein G3M70_03495 [Candidatus Nitronauta litoralis]|uniref:Uncharacterized protein n=1 Tax=Candidatus Nitronauta litoralis TaxID=2705533 RepID=A0A7T0BU68_9BACT|nr:MAG: hypothetical protein G3M70_03495 [Candidatus Nitronauta litoralis]
MDLVLEVKESFYSQIGVLVLSFLVTLVVSTLYTHVHIPAGHNGYVRKVPRIFGKGGNAGSVPGPGNCGFSLFRNRATNIDMRPATFHGAFKILTMDDLMVTSRSR